MRFFYSSFFLTVILFSTLSQAVQPSAETLDAISVSDTAADSAQNDPIVRPRVFRSDVHQTNASPLQALARESAVPIAQSGGAGGLSQVVGAGSSALDTSVQALGIPLNSIQGGGFDFSIFPSYLWSSLSLRMGSQLGLLDPRATAGTLSLVPWTLDVLDERDPIQRLTLSGSTLDVGQVSAGIHPQKGFSLLGGYGIGAVRGPSGSTAMSVSFDQRTKLTLQALATRIETEPKGSEFFPTPRAFQRTFRLIPTAMLEQRYSKESFVQIQPFYDAQRVTYTDDDRTIAKSQNWARQFGTESTLKISDVMLNAGTRRLRFRSSDFRAPEENQSHAQVSIEKKISMVTLNPTFGWVWVTSAESSPNLSFGASVKPAEKFSLYARASMMRRYGTLFDRYYNATGVRGNPGIQPEIQRAVLAGFELQESDVTLRFESLNRSRSRTQESVVRSGVFSKENIGHSFSTYDELSAEWRLQQPLSLKGATSYSKSSFARRIQNVASAIVRSSESARLGWSARAGLRQSARTRNRLTGDLPSYYALDADFDLTLSERLQLLFRAENLNQARIETVKGYPQPGRVGSFALQVIL